MNDVADPATLANLLRHDSTYGPWGARVYAGHNSISVNGQSLLVCAERDPANLPWHDLGVDLVIEATGRFRRRDQAAAHLAAGARKVVLTAPGKDVDATIVLGVNEDTYRPDAHLLDGPHSDPRRARSAAVNLIPTSTGAAAAIGDVLPELAGRLAGVAVRVPVENGSLTDLTVEVTAKHVTPGQVNRAFAEAASGRLKSIMRYTDEPIVSRDILGDPASCILDASLTTVSDNLVKVFGWYDNEWGYANRTLDLVHLMSRTL